MKRVFDKDMIYDFSDADIMQELCQKLKSIRFSCCLSQQEFAEKCGVSIITIKRIESGKANDITMGTLLKIMRISGTLEGVVDLLPDIPASPYLINEKTGQRIQRFNSKRMQA